MPTPCCPVEPTSGVLSATGEMCVIHEIAGHTFNVRNVASIYPIDHVTPSRAELKVMTTGGLVTVILEDDNLTNADKLANRFASALLMQDDENRCEP